MPIPIPDEQYRQLTTAAQAAGYDNVSTFISSLADDAAEVRSDSLSESEITASESRICRGEEDLAAGRTQEMLEALLALGEKRGYSLEE